MMWSQKCRQVPGVRPGGTKRFPETCPQNRLHITSGVLEFWSIGALAFSAFSKTHHEHFRGRRRVLGRDSHSSVDAYANPISSLVNMEPASDPSRFEIVERAVELRADSKRLAELLANGAEFIAVWRGQNLFGQTGQGEPDLVPASKAQHLPTPIFLGLRADGVGLFAVNVADAETHDAALLAIGLAPFLIGAGLLASLPNLIWSGLGKVNLIFISALPA